MKIRETGYLVEIKIKTNEFLCCVSYIFFPFFEKKNTPKFIFFI